ncbi:hypothetical protein B0H10DRAFT_527034 [Mycena sp. CBHHK59/15]|nr:hypothetical protein B0H10DRAFT_527034 [Mycena sp. CBHHK59/15]
MGGSTPIIAARRQDLRAMRSRLAPQTHRRRGRSACVLLGQPCHSGLYASTAVEAYCIGALCSARSDVSLHLCAAAHRNPTFRPRHPRSGSRPSPTCGLAAARPASYAVSGAIASGRSSSPIPAAVPYPIHAVAAARRGTGVRGIDFDHGLRRRGQVPLRGGGGGGCAAPLLSSTSKGSRPSSVCMQQTPRPECGRAKWEGPGCVALRAVGSHVLPPAGVRRAEGT